MSHEAEEIIIPDVITDTNTTTRYKKGRFFGKGGFAKCYEIISFKDERAYAGKIVSKKLMAKQNQKEKMKQEIQIHQTLKHKNVVGFYGFFEDPNNIYIVLELCRKRSMMEMLKRRKMITEPETRFYMRQILSGVQYLHARKIIHRDLKLGNLFLSDELQVKIGDFGLAAIIEFDGERKKTLCGTPNYIAPEILYKKGHSFEVDIWSIGCIMYTLLIGRPPFETSTLKETYSRIKNCQYKLVGNLTSSAKNMIVSMLQSDPTKRPKITALVGHEFITAGYCPPALPVSCLTMAPRFDKLEVPGVGRKPLSGLNTEIVGRKDEKSTGSSWVGRMHAFDARENFHTLRVLLSKVLKLQPTVQVMPDEMTDPAAQPTVWVSKWVDYSDKYGFGYQLSDGGVGVMFNDTTKLIMLPNGLNVHYVERTGEEIYMTMDNYAPVYDKKMKLLSYFSRYMREHLIMTGADEVKESDSLSRSPYLHQWCRSTSGVLMQLNNGTVQMNFSDHTKIIMCPLMAAITYIDEDKQFRTFRFSTLEKSGCYVSLYEKMRYAAEKLAALLDRKSPDVVA